MTLSAGYLWFKALHIAFMVTWFAGLFYLPRLFIYHSQAERPDDRSRFTTMERRLFAIMTIGAVLTTLFGGLMLWINPSLFIFVWFQLKVALLILLVVYHVRCYAWIRRLAAGNLPANTTWLRWFNEIPVLFLLGIIGLAVIKPM